jgi:hypothetical protein
MLAVAEFTGVADLDALAFVAHRYQGTLGLLDSAEPARRAVLEMFVAEDFKKLATAYKQLRRAVERGGDG